MNKIALFLIKLYRGFSFLFPRQCKYFPTCSEYAREAFEKHTFFKALKFTLLRIFRCNLLAKGGFDPVK